MKLELWQLALHVRDHEPDGTVYATQEEAEAAKVAAAREHLQVLCSTGHNFFEIYEDVMGTQPPAGKLPDAIAVRLAEEYLGGEDDEFHAAVYPIWVEIPTEKLRALLDAT